MTNIDPKKLFVGNLSWNIDTAALVDAFAKFGEIDENETQVKTDRETGRSRGFAFVAYTGEGADEAAAAAVEEMQGMELDGREIRIEHATQRAPRED